jgi:hypothetical protein
MGDNIVYSPPPTPLFDKRVPVTVISFAACVFSRFPRRIDVCIVCGCVFVIGEQGSRGVCVYGSVVQLAPSL